MEGKSPAGSCVNIRDTQATDWSISYENIAVSTRCVSMSLLSY